MEVPASAGTAKSPYLEVFFRVLSLLRVMFLKTHMSEGAPLRVTWSYGRNDTVVPMNRVMSRERNLYQRRIEHFRICSPLMNAGCARCQ